VGLANVVGQGGFFGCDGQEPAGARHYGVPCYLGFEACRCSPASFMRVFALCRCLARLHAMRPPTRSLAPHALPGAARRSRLLFRASRSARIPTVGCLVLVCPARLRAAPQFRGRAAAPHMLAQGAARPARRE
jgi:hypothetical protein